MDVFKGLGKIDRTKSEKISNKDISLDIVRKPIKILQLFLTVVCLIFFMQALVIFLCYVEEKSTLFFIIFHSSRDTKITKAQIKILRHASLHDTLLHCCHQTLLS